MFWIQNSRSPFQRLHRFVRAKKFYKTIKYKLDRQIERWWDSQPDPEPDSEYIEYEPDGSLAQRLLGGALQVRFKFFRKNGNRKV
tara:strand:- start:899 stop:1153 length:255 start_codon:yes stop_codon:yes gene_type:complete